MRERKGRRKRRRRRRRRRRTHIIGKRSEPPLSVELSEFSLYLYLYIYIYIYIPYSGKFS